MKYWAVITGAGTGIGSALAKELASNDVNILAIGRRLEPLLLTKADCSKPENIHPLAVDIACQEGRSKILEFIPAIEPIKYLVQNAAVGVPGKLLDLVQEDFEYAMSVNVTAPLMLTKGFHSRLAKAEGRIIHIGTGVAFTPQLGTTTYGVTKIAFHRLYKQLEVELRGSGIKIANILPGVVDTEGLWEHIRLAKGHGLPHVEYFDRVQKAGEMISSKKCAKFIKYVLMDTSDDDFSKEWNIHDRVHWPSWKPNQDSENEK